MTTINHWGKFISDRFPSGGVIAVNNVEFINEEVDRGSIDLTYESGWAEFQREKNGDFITAYWAKFDDFVEGVDPTPSAELMEEWREEYNQFDQPPATHLIGAWRKDEKGLYEPDPDGEYSAIVNYDSMTIQVVRSVWVSFGRGCSPCYPGQIDLDTYGDYMGYDLPIEIYGGCRNNPGPIYDLRTLQYAIVLSVHRVVDGVIEPGEVDRWSVMPPIKDVDAAFSLGSKHFGMLTNAAHDLFMGRGEPGDVG